MGLTGTDAACDHLHVCLQKTSQAFGLFHQTTAATADTFKSEGSAMHLSETSHVRHPLGGSKIGYVSLL